MFPLTYSNSAGAAPDSSVLLLDPRSAVSSDVLPHLVGLCGCVWSSDWLQASGASSSIRAENAVAGLPIEAARCERASLNEPVRREHGLLVLTDVRFSCASSRCAATVTRHSWFIQQDPTSCRDGTVFGKGRKAHVATKSRGVAGAVCT